eukprot:2860528-Rhodomonas_salina.2
MVQDRGGMHLLQQLGQAGFEVRLHNHLDYLLRMLLGYRCVFRDSPLFGLSHHSIKAPLRGLRIDAGRAGARMRCRSSTATIRSDGVTSRSQQRAKRRKTSGQRSHPSRSMETQQRATDSMKTKRSISGSSKPNRRQSKRTSSS